MIIVTSLISFIVNALNLLLQYISIFFEEMSRKRNLLSSWQPEEAQHHKKAINNYQGIQEQELKLEQQTCWRTNLLIASEEKRVDERNLTFKKRTSFEENLVNDLLQEMKSILQSTGLSIKQISIPNNDTYYSETKQSKGIPSLESNTYLTEEQKWQLKETIFNNQQNFSIFMRLSSLFDENKEQLDYLLSKIIHYVNQNIKCNPNHKKKVNIKEFSQNHKIKLVQYLLNQQIVKVMSPLFFSNANQEPLMMIVSVWLFNILCIKNGVYDEEGLEIEPQQENFMDVEPEQIDSDN